MPVFLLVGLKCMLAASHGAPRWVTVSMLTRQMRHYAILSTKRGQCNNCNNHIICVMPYWDVTNFTQLFDELVILLCSSNAFRTLLGSRCQARHWQNVSGVCRSNTTLSFGNECVIYTSFYSYASAIRQWSRSQIRPAIRWEKLLIWIPRFGHSM